MTETATILKASELQAGTHFWAMHDDQLVMMMKDEEGYYYVCGGWECSIPENSIEVIEIVHLPKGYTVNQLYYL
jgi:hypothetical protein